MKRSIQLLFLSLFICSYAAQAQSVDVNTFEKDLNSVDNIQLLDVRTASEFESGHLKNAMFANWLDKPEFMRRTEALDKDKPLYIYCLSGGRSAAAAKALRERGFHNVIDMQGGIGAWKKSSKPLVGQEKVIQISDAEYDGMLQSDNIVLVDFGAPWCPPCRKMEPLIQEIEKENESKMILIKIDGGSQDNLMKSKEIEQMPTFILYKNGAEVWRKSGLLDKLEIQNALKAAY